MTLYTKACAVFLIGFLMFSRTPAYALDEVYSPNVTYRELSLEYNGNRTFDGDKAKNDAEEHQLALEAGLTPRWVLETGVGFANTPDTTVKLQDFEIENRFQFFETGENWIDAGLLVAYDFSTQSQQADAVETKLLLQKDVSRFTTTVNMGFTQDVGSHAASGGPDYVVLVNTRYNDSSAFQPGFELQGDLGQARDAGHISRQQDYVGPTAYGRIIGNLKYQVGVYAGITPAATQAATRAQLEYEFHF